jgi:MarR family transcriptional regulator for hemolysin
MSRVVALTGKAIREYFEEALGQENASLATWIVMYGIENGASASQRDLAKSLRIEGATLTRHLDRMERDGLIVRTRDEADRRQIRAELTAEGKELYRRLKVVARRTNRRVCEGLSEQDQAHLRRILGHIRANVGGDRADRRAS